MISSLSIMVPFKFLRGSKMSGKQLVIRVWSAAEWSGHKQEWHVEVAVIKSTNIYSVPVCAIYWRRFLGFQR